MSSVQDQAVARHLRAEELVRSRERRDRCRVVETLSKQLVFTCDPKRLVRRVVDDVVAWEEFDPLALRAESPAVSVELKEAQRVRDPEVVGLAEEAENRRLG